MSDHTAVISDTSLSYQISGPSHQITIVRSHRCHIRYITVVPNLRTVPSDHHCHRCHIRYITVVSNLRTVPSDHHCQITPLDPIHHCRIKSQDRPIRSPLSDHTAVISDTSLCIKSQDRPIRSIVRSHRWIRYITVVSNLRTVPSDHHCQITPLSYPIHHCRIKPQDRPIRHHCQITPLSYPIHHCRIKPQDRPIRSPLSDHTAVISDTSLSYQTSGHVPSDHHCRITPLSYPIHHCVSNLRTVPSDHHCQITPLSYPIHHCRIKSQDRPIRSPLSDHTAVISDTSLCIISQDDQTPLSDHTADTSLSYQISGSDHHCQITPLSYPIHHCRIKSQDRPIRSPLSDHTAVISDTSLCIKSQDRPIRSPLSDHTAVISDTSLCIKSQDRPIRSIVRSHRWIRYITVVSNLRTVPSDHHCQITPLSYPIHHCVSYLRTIRHHCQITPLIHHCRIKSQDQITIVRSHRCHIRYITVVSNLRTVPSDHHCQITPLSYPIHHCRIKSQDRPIRSPLSDHTADTSLSYQISGPSHQITIVRSHRCHIRYITVVSNLRTVPSDHHCQITPLISDTHCVSNLRTVPSDQLSDHTAGSDTSLSYQISGPSHQITIVRSHRCHIRYITVYQISGPSHQINCQITPLDPIHHCRIKSQDRPIRSPLSDHTAVISDTSLSYQISGPSHQITIVRSHRCHIRYITVVSNLRTVPSDHHCQITPLSY